jgi:hypothetical protein
MMNRWPIEINAYKHPVNGAWILTTIVGNYYKEQAFYYYSKRKAIAEFRAQVRKELGK